MYNYIRTDLLGLSMNWEAQFLVHAIVVAFERYLLHGKPICSPSEGIYVFSWWTELIYYVYICASMNTEAYMVSGGLVFGSSTKIYFLSHQMFDTNLKY